MKKVIKILIIPVLLIGMNGYCGGPHVSCSINLSSGPLFNFKSAVPGNGAVILEWDWIAHNNKGYPYPIADPAASYGISVISMASAQVIAAVTMPAYAIRVKNIPPYSTEEITNEFTVYNLKNDVTYEFFVTAFDSSGKTISKFMLTSTPTSHPVLMLNGELYVINPDTYETGIFFPAEPLSNFTVDSTNDILYGYTANNIYTGNGEITSYRLSDFGAINASAVTTVSSEGQSGVLTLNRTNHFLYVTGNIYQANTLVGNIAIIDATNMTMVSIIDTPGISTSLPDTLGDIEIDPSLHKAVVCDPAANMVFIVDTSSNTVVSGVTVGTGPYAVAIDTSPHRAYITNTSADTVSVLDITSGTIIATIAVGSQPEGIAVNPSTHEVYVANSGYGSGYDTVSVIDNLMNTVNIAVSGEPHAISIDPATNYAYVVTSSGISVIDTTINNVIHTIGGLGNPYFASIAVVP